MNGSGAAGTGARPLRVLHVVSYFPPDRMGGVGEVAAHVHRGLLGLGHDSTVLTSGTSRDDPRVIRVARSPTGFALRCWRGTRLAGAADVVHLHHGEALALVLATRAMRVRVPTLLTLHVSPARIRESMRPFDAAGRRLGRRSPGNVLGTLVLPTVREWLDRKAIPRSDRLTFISRSAARDVLAPAEAESARVIYNGVPPAGEVAAAEPVELLFVGAPSVRKRIHLLPFVLARIRRERPACRMRVIGFGPTDDREFCDLARAQGVLDAFVFEGRMRSSELPPFYRASQVLLVPSAYEGLPMVVLEAYANGLPCVATRVSGHPEVVEDGRSGYLVPVDDPEAMAEAASRVLADPQLARRMAARGREVVSERFRVERQVREYIEVYEELAGARRSSAEASGRGVGAGP